MGKTKSLYPTNSVPFVDPRLSVWFNEMFWNLETLQVEYVEGNAVELCNQKAPQHCIEVLIQQGIWQGCTSPGMIFLVRLSWQYVALL